MPVGSSSGRRANQHAAGRGGGLPGAQQGHGVRGAPPALHSKLRLRSGASPAGAAAARHILLGEHGEPHGATSLASPPLIY